MLAFHDRLLKVGGDDPGMLYDELISNDIFATVGFKPAGKSTLSLEQWTAFMLEEEFKTQS